jgi:general secretion pathway protein N
MPSTRTLALTGLLLIIVFTIVRFPARTAVTLFAPADVGAFGVDGTVWSGRARIINARGLQLRNTEWDLALSQLLLGRLGGDLKSRWAGGFIEGFGYVTIGGQYSLRDTTVSVDVSMLDGASALGNVGGQLAAQLDELDLVDNWPTRLVGSGEIRDLSSSLMGQGAAQIIGDIGFEFNTAAETAADMVTGQLRDTGGSLEVDGTLVLMAPRDYELKTRIKPRANAPANLRNNLGFLGAPEPDGTYIFQLAGSI